MSLRDDTFTADTKGETRSSSQSPGAITRASPRLAPARVPSRLLRARSRTSAAVAPALAPRPSSPLAASPEGSPEGSPQLKRSLLKPSLDGIHIVCILDLVTSRDIIDRLKADGWILVNVRGSHHQYKRPNSGGRVTVPHPKKDLPKGTLRSIFRQAGWDWPPRSP